MASAGGIDREKAKQVALQIMGDVASAMHSAMNFIGDRLGLFKAMIDAGPLTVEQLAAKTELNQRYLQEWLNSMAAAQYLEYDPAAKTYLLTPEYAVALAEEGSPYFVGSYFQVVQATTSVAPKVADAFRTGSGLHPSRLSAVDVRGDRAQFAHALPVQAWRANGFRRCRRWSSAGARAASRRTWDAAAGAPAILMAKAFPNSRIFGFDLHAASIERARRNAADGRRRRPRDLRGRQRRTAPGRQVRPRHRPSTSSMTRSIRSGLMRSVRNSLTPGGTYLVQEINVSSKVEENVKPMGKLIYSVSTLYCMTTSLAHGGAGIGVSDGRAQGARTGSGVGFLALPRTPHRGRVRGPVRADGVNGTFETNVTAAYAARWLTCGNS